MLGWMAGTGWGAWARRAVIYAFWRSSSVMRAFMADWYSPSSMAAIIPAMPFSIFASAVVSVSA